MNLKLEMKCLNNADVDEFILWCQLQRKKPEASSRSHFVDEKLKEQMKKSQ